MTELTIDIDSNEVAEVSEQLISGSFQKSFIKRVLIVHFARGAIISFGPAVSAMEHLNPTLKVLLLTSPLISSLFTQIPMSLAIHQNGGQKAGIMAIGVALSGMIMLSTLHACTDVTTIGSFVDWRYPTMLISGAFIGQGYGTSLLIMDALKWIPQKNSIRNFHSIHAFMVDFPSATTPLVIYFFSPWGYFASSSIYTGLVLMSGLATFFLEASPYNQLKTILNKETAKELATKLGQLPDMIQDYDNITISDLIKSNCSALIKKNIMFLGFSMFVSFGSFYVSRTVLPGILTKEFGLSRFEAVLATSIGSLTTILARPIGYRLVDRYGGIAIHTLGSGLALAGTVGLAAFKLPAWALYPSIILTDIGLGFNMVAPFSIASAWCKQADTSTNEFNPATIFSLFITLGSVGGILMSLMLSLMAEQGGTNGYQNYFFTLMMMTLACAISVPIIDAQVRNKSLFASPLSFFNKVRTIFALEQPASINTSTTEPVIEEILEREDNIYPNTI